MAGEWETIELGQVAEKIGSGATPRGGSETYLTDGPFALIRSQNVLDLAFSRTGLAYINPDQAAALSNVEVRPEDVLINITGDSVARVCMVDASILPARVNQHVAIIRSDVTAFDQRYLLYSLVEPKMKERLLSLASAGATRSALTKGDLERLRITRPTLSEQRRIADLLGSLDDKIERNRRNAETLEAMARTLFKSWFVDFDAVRAKAEGRATGLPDDVAALFPDSFGENGLPDGWSRAPLLDHARLISGGTPKTSEAAYWDGSLLWASAKDVSQCPNGFLISTERTITQRGLEESATRIVPKFSTVVVARGATTGRHCLFGREMAMNQTCYALSSVAGAPFWLACSFTYLVDELVQGAHGSVFDTITTTTLNTARVTIASPEVVRTFEDTVKPIYLRMLSAIEENSSIKDLRDTLLPKLISGELRIANAEAQVSAA